MNIFQNAAGMLKIEITCAEPEAALEQITASGIGISNIRKINELTYSAYIIRSEYNKLRNICDKRGANLRIVQKKGLYWRIRIVKKRPVLVIGILFLTALVCYLPSRILFVRVEGNKEIPSNQILSAAENCGIHFGASRRNVRSESIKNELLSSVPELQWTGVNTVGCTAVISVRERAEEIKSDIDDGVTHMVAARDGYIMSGTVTQGNGLFYVGQTVKKGQILISGYTDCGIFIRGSRSAGEVFAQTKHHLEAAFLKKYESKEKWRDRNYNISLRFRKKRINLWKDSGILDTTCDRIYKEYCVSLPGGFQLPIALCIEVFDYYDTKAEAYTREEATKELGSFAERYLPEQMIAGQIFQRRENVSSLNDTYCLIGNYICNEMICREQKVQIGEING